MKLRARSMLAFVLVPFFAACDAAPAPLVTWNTLTSAEVRQAVGEFIAKLRTLPVVTPRGVGTGRNQASSADLAVECAQFG